MASRKLRITAKEALKIAEKLYTQGFISYPRTETNIFPSSLNLNSLVEMQTDHPNWGGKFLFIDLFKYYKTELILKSFHYKVYLLIIFLSRFCKKYSTRWCKS